VVLAAFWGGPSRIFQRQAEQPRRQSRTLNAEQESHIRVRLKMCRAPSKRPGLSLLQKMVEDAVSVCASRNVRRCETILSSHDLGLLKRNDLVSAEAELGQHLAGLLAELRRPCCHFARRARRGNPRGVWRRSPIRRARGQPTKPFDKYDRKLRAS
jgi:hypothetical protein